MTTFPMTFPIEVGEFISIPAWNVEGQVLEVKPAMMGSEGALEVLLQTYPDEPVEKCRRYRLEPHEYQIVG